MLSAAQRWHRYCSAYKLMILKIIRLTNFKKEIVSEKSIVINVNFHDTFGVCQK